MKKLWSRYDLSILSVVYAMVLVGVTIFVNATLAAIELLLFFIICVCYVYVQKTKRDKLLYKIDKVTNELDFESGQALNKLGVACAVIEQDGKIFWLNEKFEVEFSVSSQEDKANLVELLEVDDVTVLTSKSEFEIKYKSNFFHVHSSEICIDEKSDENVYILYFFNQTNLKLIEKEFKASRPAVMISVIDNADVLYQNFSENECASILTKIERLVMQWAQSYGTVCRKISNSRTLILVEQRNLQRMIADKFKIIEEVRNFSYNDNFDLATLSIGIGQESSLAKCNDSAQLALDMAQSRGGDQVAIRHENEYQFFGGISQATQINNKVHTRLVAKSIAELIELNDDIYIMGHKFSDFDAFASALGIYQIAKYFKKNAKIVVDLKTTLSKPLIQRFADHYGVQDLISPDEAIKMANEDSLIVVVDTHKKNFCECPELLDISKKIMVIDHHRKSVDYINNALVFYHMPNSSSAAEMVTEIIEYIDNKNITDQETALALLTGIVLDTRNFILRTSPRTFEAAAYLKSEGASTVLAKKLFSTDIDVFRQKNAVINTAEQYNECSIAVANIHSNDIRLICAQAADEMLNIDGVKASFVMYDTGEFINISARSYGEINVQLVMEAFGGGGHQSMSACQIYDKPLDKCVKALKKEIDKYLENTNN